MTIDIEDFGRLMRNNGVDITQSKYYVKSTNLTYIDKLIQKHDWLLHDSYISNIPTPVINEQTFHQQMGKVVPLANNQL